MKKIFVLVHGAFYGGWIWRDVARGLREKGHDVSSPTLSGIGERRHEPVGPIRLADHIEDVVAHIEMEDLLDVTLVGWSYGGMVVTGVVNRIAERITRVVYLDAFVPEDGRSLYDYDIPQSREIAESSMKQDQDIPPFPLEFLDLRDGTLATFVTARQSPQPWRTWIDPVQASNGASAVQKSYIRCTRFAHPPFEEALARMRSIADVRIKTISEGHLCMLTAPDVTIDALDEMS